jgi:predicted patatin/cPLA2 family phospholipase
MLDGVGLGLSSATKNIPSFGIQGLKRPFVPDGNNILTCENYDRKLLMKKEQDAQIEYMLSIHSTQKRSRRRLHIRGKEDVITINEMTLLESSVNPSSRVAKLFQDMENKNNIASDSISFSGGGYNCVYHLGVVRYIFEKLDLFKGTKYLGASGGAGIVCLVLCYENDENRFKVIDMIIKEIIALKGSGLKLHKQVEKYSQILGSLIDQDKFNRFIKDSDRCHISVTNISSGIPINTIKSKFQTYEQFNDTLKASASIPFVLDDTVRTIDNRSYLDGGLSNNLPILNNKTIRISCINYYPVMNADIYPKIICEIKYSFVPPEKNYILNMHDLGYSNMEEYMKQLNKKLELRNHDIDLDQCIQQLINDPEFIN